VIYEDLLAQRRAALHRRVGELLERHSGEAATRNAAQIALHFERGRDPVRAARYLAHAGDNATRLLASHEAERHYGRALSLIARLPLDQEQPARLELLRKRGLANLALSRFEPAAEEFTQLLEAAGVSGAPALEAEALAGLCDALFFSHRIEAMAVRAEQALYSARTSGSAALHRQALLLVAQILQEEGQLEECGNVLDEVLPEMRAAGEHRGLLRGLAYRGSLHYWQTEYPEAAARLGEALELARQQRDGLAVLICLQFLGLAHGNCGAVGRAKAILRESLELARRNEDRFWLPHLATHLGWLHRELLDVEGALARDIEALRIARDAGVEPAEASALLNLCLDYVAAGRDAEATEAVRDIERLRARAGWFGWLYEIRFENVLAERCLAAAALDEAQLRAERVLDAAGVVGARTYVAGARRILAEAALARGDAGSARSHLQEALAVLGDRTAPLIRWRVNASLGRAARADGDAPAAREAFARAAALMRELAANCDEAALRETFLGSGPALEVLRGAGGYPAA
jgi:tetratricopeptide (TPR) repeat protein